MVKNAVKVYARLKPESNRKHVTNYQILRRPRVNIEEDVLVLAAPLKIEEYIDHRPGSWNFSFYQIFDEETDQLEIFENVASPVLESVLKGYNGTIFAYGQTSSGKTYTITGDQNDPNSYGIVPRTLHYLFDVIGQHPENLYSVEVAYLEIYNENGYDLLDRKQRREFGGARLEDLPRVTIQEDEAGRLHLKNLTFHNVKSEGDAIELLLLGDSNRVIADTPMNPQSSRSHCIFTIVISTKRFGTEQYRRAKVHLVDLAGSERVYKCAITGTILTEAKHINLSLHYLEQVIVCLGQESAGHIPYRNSLLTAILRDSLGGNCLTRMLATLSVSSANLEETISTCRFSQRVALIKNDVDLSSERDVETENALLKLENERLRRQIEALTKDNFPQELTMVEKLNLDSQLEDFLKSNVSIHWERDSRKVHYCFKSLRDRIVLDGKAYEYSKKLEYYRNLVGQRDKEISLLIGMLKKEEASKNNVKCPGKNESCARDSKTIDVVTLEDTLYSVQLGSECKKAEGLEPNFREINKCNLVKENLLEIQEKSKLKDFRKNQEYCKMMTEPSQSISQELYLRRKTKSEHSKDCMRNEKCNRKNIEKDQQEYNNNIPTREECQNNNECRVLQTRKHRMPFSGNSTVALISPCTILDLNLCATPKDGITGKDSEIKQKDAGTDQKTHPNNKRKSLRQCGTPHKVSETNISPCVETVENKETKERERLKTLCGSRNQTAKSQKGKDADVYKSETVIDIGNQVGNKNRNSDSDFVRGTRNITLCCENNDVFESKENLKSLKLLVVNSSKEQEKYKTENIVREFASDLTGEAVTKVHLLNTKSDSDKGCFERTTLNEKPRKENNFLLFTGGSRPFSDTERNFLKQEDLFSDVLVFNEPLENSVSQTQLKREEERVHHQSKGDSVFKKPLPLTGDPEIDEEIIAFYKAKRTGGAY